MLSKMMKEQPLRFAHEHPDANTVKRHDEEVDEKKKKAKYAASVALTRSAPGSNWEKFKDLVNHTDENGEPSRRTKPAARWKNKRGQRKPSQSPPTIAELNSSSNEAGGSDGAIQTEARLTKQIAMDCEMVGIGDGTESMIARVSLVNRYGVCVYDKYVKPREPVSDYRTAVSGIRPRDVDNGEEFDVVQREVAEILKGRILIGHALKHDLTVLFLSHPKRSLRDTSRYKPFRKVSMGNTPSLKKLAAELLGVAIQTGEHDSVEDARTAMQLYVVHRNKWEKELYSRK